MSKQSERVSVVVGAVLTVLNAGGLLAFAGGLLHVRGRFADIFEDLLADQALPIVTQFFLSVPSWVVLLTSLALLAFLVAKEWIRPRWVPLVLNLSWTVIGIALWVVFAVAMMAPLIAVIEETQS